MTTIEKTFPSESKESIQKKRMKLAMDPNWEYGIDMIQILRSEKYRLEFAINHSDNKKQVCDMLGISRWTYERWIKKYNVKGH